MPKKQKSVFSSTHIDSQGMMMTKEALESLLPFLNGERRVKLGVEHVRAFPPMGIITNGEIFQGEDGHHYITAESIYFDNYERVELEDGTVFLKESFKDEELNKPFLESEPEEISTISISTDPANFENPRGFEELMKTITQESEMEFEQSMIGRKSELPDPELVVRITDIIVIALGIGASKIPQKIGEAIGEDLAKFYKLIKTTANEMIKRTIPANRPKNFVIEFNYKKAVIELIISTNNTDDVLNAVSQEKIYSINDKLEKLKRFKPEKVQFLFNKDKEWEFNFLLTNKGEAIGKEKSFRKRNETFKRIIDHHNLKKGKGSS
jgi:predicted hydrocarbon binding protein